MIIFKSPEESLIKFSDLEAIIKQLTKALKSQKIEKIRKKIRELF